MTNTKTSPVSRGHAPSVHDSPNAMVVKVFDAIYLSGLYGSSFGSGNGFAGGPTVIWLFTAGVRRARTARQTRMLSAER